MYTIKLKTFLMQSLASFNLRFKAVRPMVVRACLALILSVALQFPVAYADATSQKLWQDTLNMVREDFPSVQHISTGELAKLIDAQAGVTLLDTRESKEYEVSHIKGAFLAEDVRDALAVLQDQSKDDAVVVYCSVGYRSSDIAQKLAQLGYTNVVNLEGSLFKWANESRPVYRGDKVTEKVHPYDTKWGRLLERKFWP